MPARCSTRFGMKDVVRRGRGRHRRRGRLARLALLARLPEPGRPAARRRRVGPVPQGRPGHRQAAGRAEPAGAAAAADARLPRRVQPGLRLRLRARRRHHPARAWPHQQPADEGRQRRGADGRLGRHRARDAGPARGGGARDQRRHRLAGGHRHQPGHRPGHLPGADGAAPAADRAPPRRSSRSTAPGPTRRSPRCRAGCRRAPRRAGDARAARPTAATEIQQ